MVVGVTVVVVTTVVRVVVGVVVTVVTGVVTVVVVVVGTTVVVVVTDSMYSMVAGPAGISSAGMSSTYFSWTGSGETWTGAEPGGR